MGKTLNAVRSVVVGLMTGAHADYGTHKILILRWAMRPRATANSSIEFEVTIATVYWALWDLSGGLSSCDLPTISLGWK